MLALALYSRLHALAAVLHFFAEQSITLPDLVAHPFRDTAYLAGWWFVKAWASMDMAGDPDHIRFQQDLQEIQGI